MIKINTRVSQIAPSLTLAISAKAGKLKSEGVSVIDFGAGEPDYNTPDFIKQEAKKALDENKTRYTPASGIMDLKAAICEKLKRDNNLEYEPKNVIISNGAKHSLFNIFQVILEEDDEVIIPSPFWLSYPEMVKMAHGVPVFVKNSAEDGFKISSERFEAAITSKTKAIILNSPNNPNGCVYSQSELSAIAAVAVKHNIVVISDEIYEELIYDGRKHFSIAQVSEEMKALTILVNGMSKAYAMTGWRIGYTAAPENVIKAITSYQSHATSNPNSIAQYASVAALRHSKEFIDEMRAEFEKRRNIMVELINVVSGISCQKPDGAFYVMMNVSALFGKSFNGKKIDGSFAFADALLEGGNVALVPGIAFGADDYVRLSYATSTDNIKEGISRIADFVSKLN